MAAAVRLEKRSRQSVDDEIELIAQRIMSELDAASSRDLSDVRYAKLILRSTDINYIAGKPGQKGSVSSGPELEIEKRAVVKALLLSTWLERLYFIIRSFLMSLVGAAITFSFVFYYGSLNLIIAITVGSAGFVASLVITRLFDAQIDKATRRIVEGLAKHKSFRNFIMDHF